MPFDVESMDGSIDEVHGSRRALPPSQPRYKQLPRLDDEIDDDIFYNRSPKPSATQAAAQTFLAMDDMSEIGSPRQSGRGRSFSMDSMRPDEHRQFVPAYKKGHHQRESSDVIPQFTEAALGFPSQPKQPSTSQRTSRRNSVSDKKNDSSGHGRNNRDDYDATQRPLPALPKRPREDEIEAARKILAAAEASSRPREPSERAPSPPATVRSATPPPIGRPRRYFTDETETGPQQTNHKEQHGTPEKIPPRSSSKRPSSSARRSVASMSTLPSRAEPVLDQHYQLDGDDEFRPPPPPPPQQDYNSMGRKRGASHSNSNSNNTITARARSTRENDSPRDVDELTSYPRGLLPSASTKAGRLRRTYSDDELSVARGGYAPSSKHSVVSGGSRQHGSRMPEFFSEEAFQTVLHNPITAHELQKFSEARLCGESVAFLAQVNGYQESLGGLSGQLAHIHKSFISDSSATQLQGVPRELLLSAHRDIKTTVASTFTGMETLFADLQRRVEQSVFTDIYPRFVREKVSLSAIQALANDRHKYQGLGDCFCLSDPNKADNPIVYASDGFVKVTGYSRREVVPRNCRFLQGPQTDRETVRSMKMALDARKDTVELILNYKKNGDPFWNLLYMAPLFDETGTLAFFIGGQVNCSTTIHSNTDVMKVLAGGTPAAKETELVPPRQIQRQSSMPSARKALLKAFGVRVDEARTLGESGMEDQVLGRMEGQDLRDQMKEFRTAYSKYLVVRADTFVIHFNSEGVSEMLHPGNTAGLVTGQDVFRFFKANMVSKETDYRSRVRLATRNGNPISVEIRLQTRRSALYRGDERFVTHWTPLKDENSATEWVVITLAPTMGL